MHTTSIRGWTHNLRRAALLFTGLALLLLSGCDAGLMGVLFQADAPAPIEKPAKENNLNRPLLGELKKYVENSEVFGEAGGVSNDLVTSLDEADKLLARIQRENQVALKNVNRQVRLMRPAHSPNIVLVVAPRLGIGDLRCYGQKNIATPHLDSLAQTGVRMTDFYAGDASPRASHWTLHTGRTASRSQDDFRIQESTCTLAETLWQGGYHTAFAGMWMAPDNATQDDSPLNHGFETWMGQLHAKDAQTAYPKTLWVNDELVELPETKEPVGAGDLIVRLAAQELKRHQHPHRPFFLMIVLPPYLDMAAQFADEELSQDTDWPISAQSYGAAVRMTDRDMGRIQAAIHQAGLGRRTSVFFTALSGANPDHARATDYFKSTGPYKTHASGLGEGNLRVPFLASFPGVIAQGTIVSRPAAMWDLLPTFTELTFTQAYPKTLDGVSFASLLKTKRDIPAHLLYWESPGAEAQAVRLGQWKGLRPAGSDALELYDLTNDPGETKNVADQHPDIIQKLVKPPAANEL